MPPEAWKLFALLGGLLVALLLVIAWFAWTVKTRAGQIVRGEARVEDVTAQASSSDCGLPGALAGFFSTSGFASIGVYRLVFPGTTLPLAALWEQRQVGVFASWTAPLAGTGLEFYTRFDNGRWIATLNSARSMAVPPLPDALRQCFPGLSPGELYAQHIRAIEWARGNGWVPVHDDAESLVLWHEHTWTKPAEYLCGLPSWRLGTYLLVPTEVRLKGVCLSIRTNRSVWQGPRLKWLHKRILGRWGDEYGSGRISAP